jgi:hypothetical protein
LMIVWSSTKPVPLTPSEPHEQLKEEEQGDE